MKRYQAILIAGVVIAALAAVGTMDAEDERAEFDHYCLMVEAGHWPDYRRIFYKCEGHGIRVDSKCRAVYIGNVARPWYRIHCASGTTETHTIKVNRNGRERSST